MENSVDNNEQNSTRNDKSPANGKNENNKSRTDKPYKKRRKRYKSGYKKPERPQMRPEECPDCPICGKIVRNLNIAIEEKNSHEPAHFECVMRQLSAEIDLKPQEKLHYLGSGYFGIIQLKEGKGLSSYSIKEKFQYEDVSKKSDWRKKMSTDKRQ